MTEDPARREVLRAAPQGATASIGAFFGAVGRIREAGQEAARSLTAPADEPGDQPGPAESSAVVGGAVPATQPPVVARSPDVVAGVTVSPVGELLLLGGGSGTGAGQWVPCPSGAALVPILKRWQFGDGPALGSILLHALAGTARSMPSFDDDARRRVVRSTSEIVRAERPASAALADALETLEGVLATDAKLGHDQLAQAVSVAAIGAAGRAAARIDELARDLSGVLTDLPDGDVLVVGDLGLSSFPSSVALASLRIAAGARRFWVAEGGGSRFGSRLTAPPLFGAGFTVTVMLDVDIARLVAGGRTALVVFQGEGKSPSGETYAALGSLAGASTAAHSGVPVFPWMPFDVPAVSADDPVLQPVIPGSGMFGADPEIKWPLDCVPANLISSTP